MLPSPCEHPAPQKRVEQVSERRGGRNKLADFGPPSNLVLYCAVPPHLELLVQRGDAGGPYVGPARAVYNNVHDLLVVGGVGSEVRNCDVILGKYFGKARHLVAADVVQNEELLPLRFAGPRANHQLDPHGHSSCVHPAFPLAGDDMSANSVNEVGPHAHDGVKLVHFGVYEIEDRQPPAEFPAISVAVAPLLVQRLNNGVY